MEKYRQQLIKDIDNYIKARKSNISDVAFSTEDEINAIAKIENVVSKMRAFNGKTKHIRR